MIYIIWWQKWRKSSPHTALPWCDSLFQAFWTMGSIASSSLWAQTHPAHGRQFLGGNQCMGEDAKVSFRHLACPWSYTKNTGFGWQNPTPNTIKNTMVFSWLFATQGATQKKKTHSRVDGKLKIIKPLSEKLVTRLSWLFRKSPREETGVSIFFRFSFYHPGFIRWRLAQLFYWHGHHLAQLDTGESEKAWYEGVKHCHLTLLMATRNPVITTSWGW